MPTSAAATTTTTPAPAAKREPFVPGIYFGLPEDQYFADPALGSSDIRALLRSGPDYWYNSPHNPNKPEENDDTESRIRGRAIHKIVLEGQKAFDERYTRRADDPFGASSADKSALTKVEKKRAAAAGMELLKGQDYDRALITGAMIRKNPHFKDAFDGGYSEVSVFWDRRIGGKTIRCKARIDKLKPRGLADLKSTANVRGLDFVQNCRNAICNYRYDIQAAHYLEGRAQLPALIRRDSVFIHAPAVPKSELSAIDAFVASVADAKDWAWVWVFFQSDNAPITWGAILSPENPIVDVARRSRERALDRYLAFEKEFGLDQMWIMAEPLQELDINEMPGWWGR